MRRLSAIFFLLLFIAAPAWSQWLPEKSDRLVNDYSSILTTDQLASLEQRLVAFSDTTSNQVVVVITPTIGGDDEDAVAQQIGQSWGVGQEDFNNGVVILIKSKTKEENWGAVAIATGYGVEGALPDIFCKRIIDDRMLGSLGDGDYYTALNSALDVILPVLAGEYSFDSYRKKENLNALVGLLVFIVVAVIILVVLSRKHPWDGMGGDGGSSFGGSSWSGGGSSWGHTWGGSTGSFGGSSGGFGGFGGGSFGGGGASGRF